MRGIFLAMAASVFLAGCGGEKVWAPDEDLARVAYRENGPARLTLFTMINNASGKGGHTSLMINGSQRVIFDPAGSFKHDRIPERNDVLYGITPVVADGYTRYHARKTWHVLIQEIDVSPAKAEEVMRLAQAAGPVGSANCARSTSDILTTAFPGQIRQTWYPVQLSQQFAHLPGVKSQKLHEYDSDDNSRVLAQWDPDAWMNRQAQAPKEKSVIPQN